MASGFLTVVSLSVIGLGTLIALVLLYRLNYLFKKSDISAHPLPEGEWWLVAIAIILILQGIGGFGSRQFPFFATSLETLVFAYFTLLIWPFFYFYIGSVTRKTSGRIKLKYLHLLLPLLLLLPFFKLSSLAEKSPFFPNRMKGSFLGMQKGSFQKPGRLPMFARSHIDFRQANRRVSPLSNNPNSPQGGFSGIWRQREQQFRLQSQMFLSLSIRIPAPLAKRIFPSLIFGNNPPFFNNRHMKQITAWIHIVEGGNLIYAWIYLFLMGFIVWRYSRKITFRSTFREKKNLIWMISLLIIIGIIQIITLFFFLSSIISLRFPLTLMFSKSVPVPLIYLMAILIYLALNRRKNGQNKGYGKNGLDSETIDMYFGRVLEYMSNNQPYRDEALALKHVADHVHIHPNMLSQIINKKQQCNFKDFINSFRVDEVKRELLNPRNQHKNILTVALESGFNSKSSFNLIFKKHTGLTPSQYLKMNQSLYCS